MKSASHASEDIAGWRIALSGDMRLFAHIWLPCAVLTLAAANSATAQPWAAGEHEITVTNKVSIAHAAKWKPKFWFGNLDDPAPPADYLPNDKHRMTKWYWRNPTHNLNFYVIGISDKTFRREGKHPETVFNPKDGWNWAVSKYKLWRLPFVSYEAKSVRFYAGWRERGNFGLKLTFH